MITSKKKTLLFSNNTTFIGTTSLRCQDTFYEEANQPITDPTREQSREWMHTESGEATFGIKVAM